MKRFTSLLVAAIVASLGTSAVHADILKGTPGSGWQDMPTRLNNYRNNNRPFWDNVSIDVPNEAVGGPLNIGNFLVGPYRLRNNPSNPDISQRLTNLQWWGNGLSYNNNGDNNTHFNRDGNVEEITAQMLLQSSGSASHTIVGWYNADNPSEEHVIWNGATITTDPVTFSPTENWGFYIKTVNGNFYMDSSLNSRDTDGVHFAIFQASSVAGAEVYYVGCEDKAAYATGPEKRGDFNDFMFMFFVTPNAEAIVPEPASLMFLGAGVVGLLVRRKR